MSKKKKILVPEEMPEFRESIEAMPEDSRIFVDRSLEIAHHIFQLMEQKGLKQKDLAEKLGKSEAEVSKWLAGMHNYTLRSLSKLEAALESAVICTPKNRFVHVPVTGQVVKSRIEGKEPLQAQVAPMEYKVGKLIHMNAQTTKMDVKAV